MLKRHPLLFGLGVTESGDEAFALDHSPIEANFRLGRRSVESGEGPEGRILQVYEAVESRLSEGSFLIFDAFGPSRTAEVGRAVEMGSGKTHGAGETRS